MNYANMIFAFVISFIFTFATTPLVKRFAYVIGAVDIPKDKRRVHKKPTPNRRTCDNIRIFGGGDII